MKISVLENSETADYHHTAIMVVRVFLAAFLGTQRPLNVYSERLVTTKVYMVYEMMWEQSYFPLNIFEEIFTTMVEFSVVCVTKSYSILQKKSFCFNL